MGVAYQKKAVIVVADEALYFPVPYPSRHRIQRMEITGPNTTVDVYSRAFTRAKVSLDKIRDDGNTKTELFFDDPHFYSIGDTIDVTDNAVGGYNTAHVVVTVVDKKTLVTDQTYTADGNGGDAALNIPAAEFPAYGVIDQLTIASNVATYGEDSGSEGALFVSKDPINEHRLSQGDLFFKFGATGTFKVFVTGQTTLG